MAQDEDFFRRNRGTHAVITGGSQGLGLAAAKRLVREGAQKIALAGRDERKGQAAAAEVAALGCECIFLRAEMSDAEDAASLIPRAVKAFGSVNALVNSAAATSRGTLTDTTLALWDEHMNTNARGPFLAMQALTRHLLETGKPGSVVNILSVSGVVGQSFLTPYAASKAALSVLTKNAANAFRSNRIRFNGINTGWMETPGERETQKKFHGGGEDWVRQAEARLPMGQLVKPDQLAGLIAYMLSPESGVMTGSIVDYDQNVLGALPE